MSKVRLYGTGLIGHEPGQKTTSRNGSVSCYPTLLPSPKHSQRGSPSTICALVAKPEC